jgi:hypothetical protein
MAFARVIVLIRMQDLWVERYGTDVTTFVPGALVARVVTLVDRPVLGR